MKHSDELALYASVAALVALTVGVACCSGPVELSADPYGVEPTTQGAEPPTQPPTQEAR